MTVEPVAPQTRMLSLPQPAAAPSRAAAARAADPAPKAETRGSEKPPAAAPGAEPGSVVKAMETPEAPDPLVPPVPLRYLAALMAPQKPEAGTGDGLDMLR